MKANFRRDLKKLLCLLHIVVLFRGAISSKIYLPFCSRNFPSNFFVSCICACHLTPELSQPVTWPLVIPNKISSWHTSQVHLLACFCKVNCKLLQFTSPWSDTWLICLFVNAECARSEKIFCSFSFLHKGHTWQQAPPLVVQACGSGGPWSGPINGSANPCEGTWHTSQRVAYSNLQYCPPTPAGKYIQAGQLQRFRQVSVTTARKCKSWEDVLLGSGSK